MKDLNNMDEETKIQPVKPFVVQMNEVSSAWYNEKAEWHEKD